MSGAEGALGGVARDGVPTIVTCEQRPGRGEGVRCAHAGKEQAD